MEIDARNEPKSTQLEDTTIKEPRDNILTTSHTPVDLLIAEPIRTEATLREDIHRVDTLDKIMAPEIVINNIKDNTRLHSSTEANPLGEIDKNKSLTQHKPDHLRELPSGHLTEDHQAILSAFKKDTAI